MGTRPLSRYKTASTASQRERDFPHHVVVPVPEGGLRGNLNLMHDWHRARGLMAQKGHGNRWCFARAEDAEAFRAFVVGLPALAPISADPLCALANRARTLRAS